jgi:hypothetical protein
MLECGTCCRSYHSPCLSSLPDVNKRFHCPPCQGRGWHEAPPLSEPHLTRQPSASAVAGEMPAAVDGAETRNKEQQTTADESPTHTGVDLPLFDDSELQTQENAGLCEGQSSLATQTRGSLVSSAAPQRVSGAKRKLDLNQPEDSHKKTTKH